MSNNKKYYFIKLKDDFFDSDEIKILESMENGYKYSNLLLKLYLVSLKNEGKLIFNDSIPYTNEMISAITSIDITTVQIALDIFKKLGLIEILSDGSIFMLDIQNFIGKSSTEAERKKEYMKKISDEKAKLQSGQMSTKCPDNFETFSDKRPPEIEKEKEIDIEIDIKIDIKIEKTLPLVPNRKIKNLFEKTGISLFNKNFRFLRNDNFVYLIQIIQPLVKIFEEQGG